MEILAQNQAQKTIEIDGIQVRCDAYGRYCLNDLHRAGGGHENHQPAFFLRNQQIKDLIDEINRSENLQIAAIESIRGGLNQGTYVVKQIVYAYAMWISATFHLRVINTFDAVMTKQPVELSRLEILQMAMESEKQKLELQAKLQLAAPKIDYYEKIVERGTLLNATQVAQKIGMSAITMNKHLDSLKVYSRGVKRARVFQQWFIDKGFGELKQTELGYSQPMFTTKGEAWVIEKLVGEGVAA